MITLFYLLGYLALIGCAITSFLKIRNYMKKTPMHARWELYPIPHEGAKAKHGGSYMEDTDCWKHEHKPNHLGDLGALLMEVLFLEATFKHNRPLWYRTYPFHLGLYMLMGGAIILIFTAILRMFGLDHETSTLIWLIYGLIDIISFVGCLCLIGGGVGLIMRRVGDPGLRTFSTPEHFFDLGLFAFFGLTGFITWVTNPCFAELASDFVYNALTFNFESLGSGGFVLHMVIGFFLMLWIPITFMSHILLKYFLYHDIRWEDVATSMSKKRQDLINAALKYKVTWAAPHMNPKGEDKTWVDVATSGYPAQEQKKDA